MVSNMSFQINRNKIKLKEVAVIYMGQSPTGDTYNNNDVGTPLLNGPTEFGLSHPTISVWTTAPTKTCRKGDLLFCVRGSTTGRMNWADKEYCIGRGICAIRAKSGVDDTFFVYYTIVSNLDRLLSLCAGSVFPNISLGDFESFEISWPDHVDRANVVAVLKTIDDRISLNGQINIILEEIGKILFKRWFVDFEFPNEEGKPYKSSGGEMTNSVVGEIPKGWVLGELGDICEITMGQSPPGESYNETGEGVPFFQGVRDFGFRFPSRRIYCTAPTRFAAEGDVLLSVRAPVGSLNVAKERSAIGRGVAALRLKGTQNGFLYYLLLETRLGWNKYESEGTVFGSATKQGVYEFKIGIPLKNLRDQFGELIEPLDKRILLNDLESHNLTLIRDFLLPRLMSGKTRIHNSDNSEEN
jgi:type I restriction enzyme S subunit